MLTRADSCWLVLTLLRRYTDSIVGRALAKVDNMGVANTTIVVFHADHGYQVRVETRTLLSS